MNKREQKIYTQAYLFIHHKLAYRHLYMEFIYYINEHQLHTLQVEITIISRVI